MTIPGNLYVTVADTCFVSCKKTGMKVILHYLEEGWLGKTQNKVQGVIYKCDVATDNKTRIKDVSDKDVIGRIDGAWNDKVYFTLGSTDFNKVAVGHMTLDLEKALTQNRTKTSTFSSTLTLSSQSERLSLLLPSSFQTSLKGFGRK